MLWTMSDQSLPTDQVRPRVALFVTCMVDAMYPDVGVATVELLERHGAHVVFPEDQTCCGQPAFNAGDRKGATKLALRFLDVFGPLVERGDVDAIVAPSGSCASMVRHSFRILLENGGPAGAPERARCVAERTYELTEYLVDVLGVESAGGHRSGPTTYHACCHLKRELGVDRQPRLLLEAMEGAEMVELQGADECCGFGGVFALWNAEISTEMGRRKARHLDASGADIVAMGDVGCVTHMNGILIRDGHTCRAVHVAELLAGEGESAQ